MQALVDRIPERLRAPLAWAAAVLFALWLHRDGLQCWFFQDDFAWLGLLRQVHTAREVVSALFDPAAQGTIRPWSERGFFLLFEYVFGFDSLPFRVAVFAAMAANVALLMWIVRRITGSIVAGAASAVVWLANSALLIVMTWSSAANEAFCPLFLLAALALFIRYAETGRRSFWWAQLVVFIVGFGVLETNVVYPALACAWALFVAARERRRVLLRSLIAPFLISVAYFVIHRLAAPIPKTGAYALHFDGQMFRTLVLYVRWTIVPAEFVKFGHSARTATLLTLFLGAALLIAAFRELMARRTAWLFCAAWFLITLSPVLPLPGHRTDYYLTIPLIGLALFAGYALWRWRVPACLAIAVYLVAMIPVTRAGEAWALSRTEQVRAVVEGVDQAHEKHPAKVILLEGITTDLFNDAIGHSPFYPLGIDNVYLTPGSEAQIKPVPDLLDLRQATLEPAIALRVLKQGGAVVYSFSGDHLRNVTETYERSAPNRLTNGLPGHVDAGNALFADLLGPEWLPAESGFRWMPAQATLRLRGPGVNGGNLVLDGYCPAELLKQGPRRLWVMADGLPVGDTKIDDPESSFHRLFTLPANLRGKASIEVELRVEPVVKRDSREYGLVFGKIAVVP